MILYLAKSFFVVLISYQLTDFIVVLKLFSYFRYHCGYGFC